MAAWSRVVEGLPRDGRNLQETGENSLRLDCGLVVFERGSWAEEEGKLREDRADEVRSPGSWGSGGDLLHWLVTRSEVGPGQETGCSSFVKTVMGQCLCYC